MKKEREIIEEVGVREERKIGTEEVWGCNTKNLQNSQRNT